MCFWEVGTDKKFTKRYVPRTSQHLCCDSDIRFAPCCGGCSSPLCWPFLVSAQLKRHAIMDRFLCVRKGFFDALHWWTHQNLWRGFCLVGISQIQRFKWNLMKLSICWERIVISASFHPLFQMLKFDSGSKTRWKLMKCSRSSCLHSQML